MENQIRKIIQESIDVKNLILRDDLLINKLHKISNILVDSFQNGKKVLFCGNGGSAADAQHLAAEFSGRFYIDRKALKSEALHCNTSYLTAVANDYGYEHVYSRIIEGIGDTGDILIGISTSGNSKNIINAFEAAKRKGVITISLVGNKGGNMSEVSDHALIVSSNNTPRIQEAHILIGHIICELVEKAIYL